MNYVAMDISEIRKAVSVHDDHVNLAIVTETSTLTPWATVTARRVNVSSVFTTRAVTDAIPVCPASLATLWPSTKAIAGHVNVSVVVLCSCHPARSSVTKLVESANANRMWWAIIATVAKTDSSTWRAEMDVKHVTAIQSALSTALAMSAAASASAGPA